MINREKLFSGAIFPTAFSIPDIDVPTEARCLVCGRPAIDHVALRYIISAWLAHRVLQMFVWLAYIKRRSGSRPAHRHHDS